MEWQFIGRGLCSSATMDSNALTAGPFIVCQRCSNFAVITACGDRLNRDVKYQEAGHER